MKILSIILKDLKTLLSDKQAIIVTMLMPLIIMTILSMALKGSFMSSDDIKIKDIGVALVKDYDEAADSQMFNKTLKDLLGMNLAEVEVNPEEILFEDFLGSEEVSKLINYRIEDEKTAMELLDKGQVSAVIILPEKYVYDMKINFLTPFRNNVDIKILTHPDRSIDGQIVSSMMDAYSNIMSSIIIGKNVLIESVSANDLGSQGFDNIDQVMEGMTSMMEGINVKIENDRVEGRRSIKSSEYYAVAMMAMFILFAAGQGGRMLLEERDNQTYQRMVIADVSKAHILTGKFFTIFLIACIQITVMVIYSSLALRVYWGDLRALILISLTSAFSVAGLGIFIASLTYRAGNYRIANLFESALIQVMALLGGSYFPLDLMPDFIQKLSFISINGVALKGYLKIILGYNIYDILSYVAILALIGSILTLMAVIIFSKEVRDNVKHNKVKTAKA